LRKYSASNCSTRPLVPSTYATVARGVQRGQRSRRTFRVNGLTLPVGLKTEPSERRKEESAHRDSRIILSNASFLSNRTHCSVKNVPGESYTSAHEFAIWPLLIVCRRKYRHRLSPFPNEPTHRVW
jgi:hypothetical protein